jgi:acyl-CoA thioesterase FadM
MIGGRLVKLTRRGTCLRFRCLERPGSVTPCVASLKTHERTKVMIGRFPIDAGHVLAFARAIGDGDPSYGRVAETTEDGLTSVVSPPTFVQASAHFDPEYPLRPRPGVRWFGSGHGPGEIDAEARMLHAEQHFEYHRPLRVGDVLTAEVTTGGTWARTGRRGGKLTFTEQITVYSDAAGERVVTVRSVGVLTEKAPTEKAPTEKAATEGGAR